MSLQLESITLGPLQTNCYLAWCDQTDQGIIIDPADQGDFITQRVLELKIEPVAIVLTHAHFDHVMGLLEVKLNFPIPIFLNSADDFLLKQAQSSAQHWLGLEIDPIPPADQPLQAGQTVRFGNQAFEVLETPGHTPGSICLYSAAETTLFSGDTVFKGTIGRTDFSYSSPEDMRKSLEKLLKLPPETRVYPGHGEATRIGEEKKI